MRKSPQVHKKTKTDEEHMFTEIIQVVVVTELSLKNKSNDIRAKSTDVL